MPADLLERPAGAALSSHGSFLGILTPVLRADTLANAWNVWYHKVRYSGAYQSPVCSRKILGQDSGSRDLRLVGKEAGLSQVCRIA